MQSNAWNFCHGIANEYKLHEGIKNSFTLIGLIPMFV